MSHINLPSPLSAVLFDLDGTLIDTAPTFILHLNALLKKHNKEELPAELIRENVSHGAYALIALAFGSDISQSETDSYRNELLDLYIHNISEGSVFFSGISKVLEYLESKSIPWGIVTNKPRQFSEALITALNLEQRCAVLVCPDDVNKTKPDPEPLFLACSKLNIKAENCIYVGDHERDIEAGNAANMFTISALYGYLTEADKLKNWNANLDITQAEELLTLLKA